LQTVQLGQHDAVGQTHAHADLAEVGVGGRAYVFLTNQGQSALRARALGVAGIAQRALQAQFGQVGPKVGSVDPGFGTAYLARIVGEKKAREIWFLCRRYTAQEALQMGLVNKVVPHADLDAECEAWAAEINALAPTALAIAKRSFNADTENIRGLSLLGIAAVKSYYQSEESKEGVRAFNEKRKPDFKGVL